MITLGAPAETLGFKFLFVVCSHGLLNDQINILESLDHRVQTRLAMTTFWRTLYHDGKVRPAW
jgi:hypothetical protein